MLMKKILSAALVAKATNIADDYCAVMFDDPSENFDGKFLEVAPNTEIENLKKVNGIRYTNLVSFVKVRDGCALTGYNAPKFKKLLGVWEQDHVMEKKFNNKLSSIKCTCTEPEEPEEDNGEGEDNSGGDNNNGGGTCSTKYYGATKDEACPDPLCDSATFEVVDSWNSPENWILSGWSSKISVPADQYDDDGWAVLLRFNVGPSDFQANFQLWNADFFNVYRKETGVEILVHQTKRNSEDTTDPNSFVIVAERMTTTSLPEVFFWPAREQNHTCFQPPKMGRSTSLQRIISSAKNVNSNNDIRKIKIKKNGKITVKR